MLYSSVLLLLAAPLLALPLARVKRHIEPTLLDLENISTLLGGFNSQVTSFSVDEYAPTLDDAMDIHNRLQALTEASTNGSVTIFACVHRLAEAPTTEDEAIDFLSRMQSFYIPALYGSLQGISAKRQALSTIATEDLSVKDMILKDLEDYKFANNLWLANLTIGAPDAVQPNARLMRGEVNDAFTSVIQEYNSSVPSTDALSR